MKKLSLPLLLFLSFVGDTSNRAIAVTTSAAPIIGSQLTNISTRGFVQTGDNVIIGGFIVQGIGPKKLIVRAIGPELIPYGVPNVLADPTLELHDGTGTLIASNDDWQHTIIGGIITADQVAAIQNRVVLRPWRLSLRSLEICRRVTTRRSYVARTSLSASLS